MHLIVWIERLGPQVFKAQPEVLAVLETDNDDGGQIPLQLANIRAERFVSIEPCVPSRKIHSGSDLLG
jgi:hypothetical protein